MKKVVSLVLICLAVLSVVYGLNVMSVFNIDGNRGPHKKLAPSFEIDGNAQLNSLTPGFDIDGNRGPHK